MVYVVRIMHDWGIKNENPINCQPLCNANPNCVGYAYSKARRLCWLKSAGCNIKKNSKYDYYRKK